MKILIIIDTLNGHNGSSKYMLRLARGFKEGGHDISIFALNATADSDRIRNLFSDIDITTLNPKIGRKVNFPIDFYIRRKMKNLTPEDVLPIFSILESAPILRKLGAETDLIISSNPFAAFMHPFIKKKTKKLTFIHEAPLFDDVIFPIRLLLRRYMHFLSHATTLISISNNISKKTETVLHIKSITMALFAIETIRVDDEKIAYVLVDTRWTDDRDPMFAIKLAQLIDIKIVFCGFFPDPNLKKLFMSKIEENGIRESIEIHENVSENDLNTLYRNAKIVARWSGFHESGTSVSIADAISYECIPILDSNLGPAEIVQKYISDELVVDRDPRAFANVINRICSDVNLYNELRAKVKEIKEKLSWVSYGDRLIQEVSLNEKSPFNTTKF